MTNDVHGYVTPGFEQVADAFAANFTEYGDRGAACTVMIDGRTLVDVYGGQARDGCPWTPQTRSVVFSASKGITTICLLMAADHGLLDLDAPVASLWPEFAANGKDRLTVRQVLAHRAGLVAPEQDLTMDDLAAWFPVVEALARQAPLWKPGSAFAYHALTLGYLAGEILRRATGKRPSEWLAQHVGAPLGLSLGFGWDVEDPDLAPILPPTSAGNGVPLSGEDLALMERAMSMGGAAGTADPFIFGNSERFLTIESPAANLVGTARDLARLYAATVVEVDGTRLLTEKTVAAATEPLSAGKPFIGPDKGDIWGTGFMVHSARRQMAGPGSFGHDGAGGQLAFAHPGLRLSFAYQTVQAGGDDDPRAELLCAALRRCL